MPSRTLSTKLPRETPATRAQREADGHLTLPCGAPHEEQVGHVGAYDQKHDDSGTHQHLEWQPRRRHKLVLQADHLECRRRTVTRIRIARAQGLSQNVEFRCRGFSGHAVREPREHGAGRAAPVLGVLPKRILHPEGGL